MGLVSNKNALHNGHAHDAFACLCNTQNRKYRKHVPYMFPKISKLAPKVKQTSNQEGLDQEGFVM